MVAVVHTLSVADPPEHTSCVEVDCHSTVAVDIVQGEGWGSRVEGPAVGTLLVVVEGSYKVVVGSLVAVHVQQQIEGKEGAHSPAMALTDMAEVLESMVVEDQLLNYQQTE